MHEFYYYAASMSIHVAHDLMVKHPSIETGFFFSTEGCRCGWASQRVQTQSLCKSLQKVVMRDV